MVIPLVILSLVPIAVILFYFYIKDKYNKEPPAILALSFGLGVLSCLPAYFMSKYLAMTGFEAAESILSALFYAFIIIALAEELAKFALLMLGLYPRKAFDEPFDGIIYAVFIGMGFAALENVIYVVQGGWEVAILRAFTAVPAHAAFGAIMGYYVGLAKFDPPNKNRLLIQALVIPILLHGIYDFFIIQEQYEVMTLAFLGILVGAIFFARKAMYLHLENSPFKDVIAAEGETTKETAPIVLADKGEEETNVLVPAAKKEEDPVPVENVLANKVEEGREVMNKPEVYNIVEGKEEPTVEDSKAAQMDSLKEYDLFENDPFWEEEE